MKRLIAVLLFSVLPIAAALSGAADTGRCVRYVDPFIGTGGHGHTYPGATVPFGMVQLSPDAGKSGWDWCSGYHYSDTGLVGFSHTHLSGTGCGDLGDILFIPTTSSRSLDDSYRSRFSHDQESAEPGYYRVFLQDHRISVELTATARAGFHRYTFPASDSSRVIINLKYGQDDIPTETYLKVESPTLVTGYRFSNGWAPNQKVFFAARFSRPFASDVLMDNGAPSATSSDVKGKNVKGMFMFPGRTDSVLLAKVGISAVSIEGALKNLDTEIPGWDFEKVKHAASDAWEQELEKVSIATTRPPLRQVFYTALYHAMLAPTLYCDVDGRYRGADDAVHQSSAFQNYSTFSLWDTYRAEHPLFTIIERNRVGSMVESMLAFEREGGYLPVWPLAANETNTMVGYHSVPVIADAYLKGIGGFDPEEALQAMKKSALRDHRGLRYYTMAPPVTMPSRSEMKTIPVTATESTREAILPGYARSLAGDTIGYHSSHPQATRALIVRASDGKQTIAWETAPVPAGGAAPSVSFVWLAGIASGKGAHTFTLTADGKDAVKFTTAKDSSGRRWKMTGDNGATLSFDASLVDVFGDLFGNMTLTLPASAVTPGKPVALSITGENGSSPDWVMVFQYELQPRVFASSEFGILHEGTSKKQLIKVDVEHIGGPAEATIAARGADPVTAPLTPGLNTFYLAVPEVHKNTPTPVSVTVGGREIWKGEVLVQPLRPYGYIPADKENESVSKTLEYAIDDWCIAEMAKALGKKDDYALFTKRAGNYKNLFDPSTGFMRGRNADGKWVTPFNPRFSTLKQPEYTEGNAWQYTWLVPQDVRGLVKLLGGDAKFVVKLDSLFNQSSNLEGTGATADVSGLIGLYAHGNEPSHHIAYLYDYVGMPWKTQDRTRSIMEQFYTTGPAGLCGNEDCGQMSAWYVLSAMGIYPVNPADGTYEIGSPILDRAAIEVGGGKTFAIVARNVSEANKYVQSATLNGHPLGKPWITYKEIMNGGTLEFVMGAKPNMQWGSSANAAPPSMTKK